MDLPAPRSAAGIGDATGPRGPSSVMDLPVKGVTTLYNRIGDVFAWICAIATLVLGSVAIVRPAPPGQRESGIA